MFVLGYRARKMRQSRLSDLIHMSEGQGEVEECTVEVHFKRIIDAASPAEDYATVEGSEMVVARTAYRNNRNVYSVNGVTSNYAQVTSLLKAHGVDLDHKRFLILQGEVEAIALMKPKGTTEHEEGLLEYLEDIIGTNKYIPAIEEAAQELDAINKVHAEKMLRVRAAVQECDALCGEKEEAESYLRQENTRTERMNELLQATLWKSRTELAGLEKGLEAKKQRLEEERSKSCEDAALVDSLEITLKEAINDATELDKKARKLQAELSLLEQNDVKMRETRKHLKNKLKQLSKQSSDGAKAEADLQRSIKDISGNIETISKDLGEKREEYAKTKAELDKIAASLKGVTAKHQKALDSKQTQLEPLQDDLRQAQQEVDLAKTTLALIEERASSGTREQSRLAGKLVQVVAEIEEAEGRLQLLATTDGELKSRAKASRDKMEKLELNRAHAAKNLQLLQSTLSEAMAALHQNESGTAVHKTLMREAKAGRIRGIHGRLGDLGAIDGKYDVAIATACGFLDHVVVDSTEVGQTCIEHLRRTNAGRANFIVLDKMRPAIKQPPSDLPAGAVRLFDLVRLKDPRYTDAMYFALHDTLVASTLAEAQRWAYGAKRWRVVTVDGKLFETSGTISGGGQTRRGGMGSQLSKTNDITAEQVDMLQAQCREAQDELKRMVAQIGDEQRLLADVEEQLMRIEAEMSLVQQRLNALPIERKMIERNLAELEKNQQATTTTTTTASKKEQEERTVLVRQIADGEAKIDAIRTAMRPIETSIEEIKQKILDAGGIKYKVQLSKVEGLAESIANAERRLHELERERLTAERRLEALRSGPRDDSAVSKTEEELMQLDQRLSNATQAATALHQEYTALQTAVEERHEQVKALKAKLDEMSKAVAKFRKVEYELRCAIEADESRREETRKTVERCRDELQHLCLHQIDPQDVAPVLPVYEEDERELAEFCRNLAQLEQTIESMTRKLERLRPNLKVLEEYRVKERACAVQQAELDDIEARRTAIRTRFEEGRRRRLDEFMEGFRTISAHLKQMYQLITLGGNAELELVDSLDPFSEGVLFSVMPPRKSWKNIGNLSGGEKTLSSLALVFALHVYRPTPIYIMDEIDAALDFRNVSIVAHYIKERTRDAQFIVISLRNNMFELADRLIGIYKTWQRTKSVAIDPARFQLSP